MNRKTSETFKMDLMRESINILLFFMNSSTNFVRSDNALKLEKQRENRNFYQIPISIPSLDI